MLEDEVFEAFAIKEGTSLINRLLRSFIVYCYKNGYITDEDLLYLYSYLRVGGNNDDVTYVLFNSDTKVTTGLVIDMRETLNRMRPHVEEFDWDGVHEYIIVRDR